MQKKKHRAIIKEHNQILGPTKREELRNALALLYQPGLRPSYILRLTAKEIDWARREIVVRPLKFAGRERAIQPITPGMEIVLWALPGRDSFFPRLNHRSAIHLARTDFVCRRNL